MTSAELAARCARGEAALDTYCRSNGYCRHSRDEALIDLLTDLRHCAFRDWIDFDRALEHSSVHFEAEVHS